MNTRLILSLRFVLILSAGAKESDPWDEPDVPDSNGNKEGDNKALQTNGDKAADMTTLPTGECHTDHPSGTYLCLTVGYEFVWYYRFLCYVGIDEPLCVYVMCGADGVAVNGAKEADPWDEPDEDTNPPSSQKDGQGNKAETQAVVATGKQPHLTVFSIGQFF
jgi:hypothetical protein